MENASASPKEKLLEEEGVIGVMTKEASSEEQKQQQQWKRRRRLEPDDANDKPVDNPGGENEEEAEDEEETEDDVDGNCGLNPDGKTVKYCRNGSICTAKDDSTIKYCDCQLAFQKTRKVVAGSMCEYEASMFCMLQEDLTTPIINNISFCTNGGTCEQIIPFGQPHQGCKCPKGFQGQYCEMPQLSRTVMHNRSKGTGLLLGVIAIGALCLVMMVFFYQKYRDRKREREMAIDAYSKTAELEFDVSYDKDDDDEYYYTDSDTTNNNNNNNNNKQKKKNNNNDNTKTIEITAKRKGGKMYASALLEDNDDAQIL